MERGGEEIKEEEGAHIRGKKEMVSVFKVVQNLSFQKKSGAVFSFRQRARGIGKFLWVERKCFLLLRSELPKLFFSRGLDEFDPRKKDLEKRRSATL